MRETHAPLLASQPSSAPAALVLDAEMIGAESRQVTLQVRAGMLTGWNLLSFSPHALEAGASTPDRRTTHLGDPMLNANLVTELWPLPLGRQADLARDLAQAGTDTSILELLTPEQDTTRLYFFPPDLGRLFSRSEEPTSSEPVPAMLDLSGSEWEWANLLAYVTVSLAPPALLCHRPGLDSFPTSAWAQALSRTGRLILERVRDTVRTAGPQQAWTDPAPAERDWTLHVHRQPGDARPGTATLQVDGHVLATIEFQRADQAGAPGQITYVSRTARSSLQNAWRQLDRRGLPYTYHKATEDLLIELAQDLNLSRLANQAVFVRKPNGTVQKHVISDRADLQLSVNEPHREQMIRYLQQRGQITHGDAVFHPRYAWVNIQSLGRERADLPVLQGTMLRLHRKTRRLHELSVPLGQPS